MKSSYSFSELRLSPEVVRILDAEIREHPRWADVRNRAGLMALAKGELDRALEHFETALEVNPDYAWAALNRAMTLGLCGRAPEAVAALPEEQGPDRGAVALSRASLALFAGDLPGGEAALAALPSDLATRPDVQRLAAALVTLRSPEEGEAAWKRVVHHFASLPPEWSRPWDDD